MLPLPLTMACGPYDRMEALWNGAVQPEGLALRYLAIQSPPEIFARMIKTRSFDVAEMSTAHYFIMRVRHRACGKGQGCVLYRQRCSCE